MITITSRIFHQKKTVYKEFGISNNMKLIGIFARIHPMKDHINILQAIKIINETSKKYQNKIYLICVGGIAQKEELLQKFAQIK